MESIKIIAPELKKVYVVAGNGQASKLESKTGNAVLTLEHDAKGNTWTLKAEHKTDTFTLCDAAKKLSTVNKYASTYGLEYIEEPAGNFNGEQVQIGWAIYPEDKEERDAGYECAAWYEDYTVKAGKYPIYAKHNYHERDKRYTREINYNSILIVVDGIITGDNFSSYFCGNMVAPKYDQNIGQKTTKYHRPYDFMLADMIEKGSAELLPEYIVENCEFYSEYDKCNKEVKHIIRRRES